MLDDFFIRALIAGIGIALIAGPFGCLIVWRKLSYLGDTLAHSALLGIALALLLQVNLMISVFAVAAIVSLVLLLLQRQKTIPPDALLGLLSHSMLAIGLVVLAFMTWVQVDLNALLFGDILAVSRGELAMIWGGGAVILGLLALIWKPLFAITVDADLAQAEGVNVHLYNLIFMLLMAMMIALSMKLVGVLLMTALLIIPSVSMRRFATGPEQMALLAAISGVLCVVAGLFASLQWDTPSGPSVVVVAFLLFIFTSLWGIHSYRKRA